ncbi:MAG: histidine kinase dimerization/phospho-acceptor domain-containing protein, partial [Bacteroidota bacterium]
MKIIIHPPFWQTIWAYMLYILLIGGSMYAFYRFNLSRQLARQEAIQLQEVNQLKSHFYTNITHEFRTPLTVILGMNRQKDNPKAQDLIERNGKKLLELINHLLDLSKIDTGNLKVNYQQIEIVSFTQYIGESFQSLADRKYIRLTIYSESKELYLDMDEEKYRQIISNLLSNAIKF